MTAHKIGLQNDVCVFEPQLFNQENPDGVRLQALFQGKTGACAETITVAAESILILNHAYTDIINQRIWRLTPHD